MIRHAWRVAPSGVAHAFASGRGLVDHSICNRVALVGTRLGRAGETVRPCKHCTRRINEADQFFKAVVRVGKK